jgi:hypothetical protein
MGIDTLNKTWEEVLRLCKINKLEPLVVFNLLEDYIEKEFYGGREKHSFWVAALYQDRLNAKNETGYAAQEYIIRNHCPLIDDRFYKKSSENIYWGKKKGSVKNEIATAHNLRQKILGIHKRAIAYKTWKEFYTKIWPRIKKSEEFAAIIKLAKFK